MTPEAEARINELATALAMGEATNAELEELLAGLRDPELGPQVASQTWAALGTVVDLRASLSSTLADTVAMAIADRDGAFADRLRDRIGLVRSRLTVLPTPLPRAPQWHKPALLVAVILAIALTIFWWPAPTPGQTRPVLVESLQGTALTDDLEIDAGATLSLDRELIVTPAARITLTWNDHRLTATGPATVVPQNNSVIVLSGQISFTAGINPGQIVTATGRIPVAPGQTVRLPE